MPYSTVSPAGQPASASAPLLRRLNAETVFKVIWYEHPISRAEIARRLGMAKPTVSNVLRVLQGAGLVEETWLPDGVVRQRGITFDPVPTAAVVLAVDVGGRYLRAALSDLGGQILARRDVIHDDVADSALPELALRLRDEMLGQTEIGSELLEEIVVGIPGIINPANGQLRKINPVRVEGFPIVAALSRSLGRRVIVENDINLAALGEQWRGLGQGVDNFAFLSIGTGIGVGLVLRGELHRGHSGAAGEIDMPGDSGSPAAHALLAFARSAYGGDVPGIPEIFEAASGGDPTARAVLHEEARRVASYIVPVARVADVELVVLGGGLGSHCEVLLDEIRELIEGKVQYPPRVELSSLGDSPVLTGALALSTSACTAEIVTRRLHAS